jgi:putative transposase
MIDPSDKKLSVRKQAKLLGINRNRLTTRQTKTTEEDSKIMKIMDELYTKCPFYGQRNLRENLRDYGYHIGRKRIRRLMRVMSIEALVPKPSTSVPAKGHEVFPYLLRKREINTVSTKSGARTLPTFRWRKVMPTWWQSWIGTAGPFSLGKSATPWIAPFACGL